MKIEQLRKIADFLRKKSNDSNSILRSEIAEKIRTIDLSPKEFAKEEKLLAYLSGAGKTLIYKNTDVTSLKGFGTNSAFTEVRFPYITDIQSCFTDNKSIDTLIFDSVTTMGKGSSPCLFQNSSLKTLIINTPTVCLLKNTFSARSLESLEKLKIYVPDELWETYKSTTNWATLKDGKILPMSDYYIQEVNE